MRLGFVNKGLVYFSFTVLVLKKTYLHKTIKNYKLFLHLLKSGLLNSNIFQRRRGSYLRYVVGRIKQNTFERACISQKHASKNFYVSYDLLY